MDYRVEDLAARAGVRVDTVRYYQSRGLLGSPRREGRVAWYDDEHLARLRRIRALGRRGFTLAQIARLLKREGGRRDAELLGALVEERVTDRTLTRAELATESGLPASLLHAAESAGLVKPVRLGNRERYTEADLEMARAGLELLNGGFPLAELLALATEHARRVGELVDRAIDLFDDHVRKRPDGSPNDPADVVRMFQLLLPQVTRLVALHFERTLVNRALERLTDEGDEADLREALAATGQASLEVSVGWR